MANQLDMSGRASVPTKVQGEVGNANRQSLNRLHQSRKEILAEFDKLTPSFVAKLSGHPNLREELKEIESALESKEFHFSTSFLLF